MPRGGLTQRTKATRQIRSGNGKPFFKQSFGEILGSMKTMMAQVHSKADLFPRVRWQPPYSNGRVPAYQTSQQLLREQYIESLIVDGQHQPLLPHAKSFLA